MDILHLLRFSQNESITLLGGEPTQHPQLLDILEIIYKKTKKVSLLTNGLADANLYEKIIKKWHTSFLVNVQSAEHSAIPLAKEKLLATIALFRKNKHAINISYTLNENADIRFLQRIIEQDRGEAIKYIRLSAPVPSVANKQHYRKNKTGDEYLKIILMVQAIAPSIVFVNECYLDYCMFSKKAYAAVKDLVRTVHGNSLLFRSCTAATKAPIEIFPDMSATYCYPLYKIDQLHIKNIFDYKSISELRVDLQKKYDAMNAALPIDCASAQCNKPECAGVCLVDKYYLLNTIVSK